MMEDPFPSTNTTAASAQNSDDAAADAADAAAAVAVTTAAAVPTTGGDHLTDVSVAILHNDVNIKSVAAADDSEEEDVKKVLSGAKAAVSTVTPGTRVISVENVRLPTTVTSLPFAPPTTTSSGSTIVAKDPAAAAIVGNILLEAAMEVDHASTESNNNDVKRDLVEEGEEDDASNANAMQIWTGEGTSKNVDSTRDVAPVQMGVLVNHLAPKEGFTYTLEAPTSGMVRKGEDSLTYLNKDQFYTLYLEYTPSRTQQELRNEVVTSIVTLQLREKKEREESLSAFEFWYSRPQQTTKVRLLEVDTKSSAGLVGDVNEVAHNAVLVRWSPLISAVNLQIAIRCLSTDFTSQKGVKGIPLHIQVRTGLQLRDSVIMSKHILPLSSSIAITYVVPVGFATFVIHIILHVQIDTYDDIQSSNMVNDRAFCQIKTFCDKGAERKAREEEKRLSRQHLSSGFSASVQPRSVFQRAFDLVTEPIFFTPKARPLPAMTPPSALTMPAAPALTNSGQLALPAPSDCPSPSASAARSSAAPSAAPSAAKRSNIASARVARGSRGGGSVPPSSEDRVMIFVRQENEEIFTPLHVVPPTVLGIVRAISAKYQIDCVDIRYLFRRNARGIVARVDDDMVRYYCNGDVFLMKVLATEETASGQVFYDIILAEVALQASTSAAPRPGA